MPQRTLALAATLSCLLLGASCSGGGGRKVGIIGDSITELSQQPLHDALDADYDIELVGKFGARADQVVPEAKVIAASKPAEVIVNLGTNDAIQQVPPAQTRKSLDEIVDALAGSSCVFLVEVNESITAKGAPRSAEAAAVNEQIHEIADRAGNVEVIPWNEAIRDHGGNGEMTFDTVHLSNRGLVVLADTYRSALNGC